MNNRVGQQLGNYRLIGLLGQGGFADVYLGEHIHLGTRAAIKVLRTQLTTEDLTNFRSEARTIAHLSHPHIVQVLDFGVENNAPFLVMAYAPNGTLRQRHGRGQPVPAANIPVYAREVAAALQYAHNQKLIHRDVKPENMLIGRNNEILLSDFGIALPTASARPQGDGTTWDPAGTVIYMAPEQIQGKPTVASDQYALGITVYEWICGSPPFRGGYMEVAMQKISTRPESLLARVPDLPPEVDKVVMQALERDPQQRFNNVQAFAVALEQACKAAFYSPPPSSSGGPNSYGYGSQQAVMGPVPSTTPHPISSPGSGEKYNQTPQQISDPASQPMPHVLAAQGNYQPGHAFIPTTPTPQAGSNNTPTDSYQRPISSNGQAGFSLNQTPGASPGIPASPARNPPWRVAAVLLVLLILIGGSVLGVSIYLRRSTPAKTLSTLCSDLLSKDNQNAYNQFSPNFQNKVPLTTFGAFFSDTSTCIPGPTTTSGNTATSTLSLNSPVRTAVDTVTLAQQSNGQWQIENETGISGLIQVLATYCSDLQQGNYQGAYSEYSSSLQQTITENLLPVIFSRVNSCSFATLHLTPGGGQIMISDTEGSGIVDNNIASLLAAGNTWEINDLSNSPDKTLASFCADLQSNDYSDAYALTSSSFDASFTLARFSQIYSAISSCTFKQLRTTSDNITSDMTFHLKVNNVPFYDTSSLVKDSDTAKWKLDSLNNLPEQTLDSFCSDLANQDYADAYNLLTPSTQAETTEARFASGISTVSSCTPDFPSQQSGDTLGSTAQSNIKFVFKDGSSGNYIAFMNATDVDTWRLNQLKTA